jgi:hypothetical protein
MTVRFQLVIDCADPLRQAAFWAAALHYDLEEPPGEFTTWPDYWRSRGLPEEELGPDGSDSIVDPSGDGPRVWFQQVPEPKTIKNRLHIDVRASRGGTIEQRKELIHAEADRLESLGASKTRVIFTDGVDHYAIAMTDPEGNEFDIN